MSLNRPVTRTRRPMRWLAALGAGALLLGVLVWLGLRAWVGAAPAPALHVPTSSVVLDRSGRLLRAFTVDGGRWRLPLDLHDVDPRFVAMLLAVEDRRFYDHAGVDPLALLRAATQLVIHGRIVSGGSTISMQLARLLEGGPTRAPAGKLRQVRGALALERAADKAQLLAAYLTVAPYGGNLEGLRAGSLAWFGKEPKRLSAAEAAFLVALPQAPEARRPDRDPVAARRARDRVLARAAALHLIDAETAASARRESVPTVRRPFPMLAPHLAARLVQAAPGRGVHHVTLDGPLQGRLELLAAERAAAIDPRVSAALLVADHGSGEVLAEVGSAGLFDGARQGHVDMTRALRSPGSALKPLIYGLAFESGIAHPASLIEDRPTAFAGYVPGNFDRSFQGTVTVRRALALSLNVPAVQLLDAVGPARLIARMRRAGAAPVLVDASPPGLAIGLGGLGVTLFDLVRIYGAIARGGVAMELTDTRDGPAAAGAGPPTRPGPARGLVSDLYPPGGPGARRYGAAGDRLQDRDLLRLPRRLGDRLRRAPCRGGLGRSSGRGAGPRSQGRGGGGADPARLLRPPGAAYAPAWRACRRPAGGHQRAAPDLAPGAGARCGCRGDPGGPGDRLSAGRGQGGDWSQSIRRRLKRRGRDPGAQGPRRPAALHLVCRRSADRPGTLRPRCPVAAGRPWICRHFGGRRARAIQSCHGPGAMMRACG